MVALLHLAVPNHYMRHGEGGNCGYYLFWGGAVAGTMLLGYHFMLRYGLVQPYLVTSTIVLCTFLGWRVLLWTLHERWCKEDADRDYDANPPSSPTHDGY
ncbi:MAG: hypothetical protein ACYC7E_17005 [Armatimonadota bacterium]